jgi:hypothetical protein
MAYAPTGSGMGACALGPGYREVSLVFQPNHGSARPIHPETRKPPMKKAVLSIGIAAAQMFAVAAFAQGAVGDVKKPPPAEAASAKEKAAARADRKAEGAAAIKQQPPGEVGAVKSAPPATMPSSQEKAAARADRKAEGADAAKKAGPGLVGPTK